MFCHKYQVLLFISWQLESQSQIRFKQMREKIVCPPLIFTLQLIAAKAKRNFNQGISFVC